MVYKEYSNRIKRYSLKNDDKVISTDGNYFNSNYSIPNENIYLGNNKSLKTFSKEKFSTNLKSPYDYNNNTKFKNNKIKRINLNEISNDNKSDNSRFTEKN